jgi:hypothetical protein
MKKTISILTLMFAPVACAFAQELPTSGSVQSRLGNLELQNGYPTDATVKKIYDDMRKLAK